MELPEYIGTNLGEEVLTKYKRRRIGGNNNAKGNQHELYFAVYKLAKNSAMAIQGETIHLRTQSDAFVDDLEVENITQNSIKNYQLKDCNYVPWGTEGIEGICFDFHLQNRVNTEFQKFEESTTCLVVSKKNQFDKLNSTIPQSISNYTECILFENMPINRLLLEKEEVRSAIGTLCTSPNDIDKLVRVFQLLVSVIASNIPKESNVLELIKQAKDIGRPEYFLSLIPEPPLPASVKEYLKEWPNISYSIENGYLKYKTDINTGILEGVINLRVDSDEFSDFFATIIDNAPESSIHLLIQLMES